MVQDFLTVFQMIPLQGVEHGIRLHEYTLISLRCSSEKSFLGSLLMAASKFHTNVLLTTACMLLVPQWSWCGPVLQKKILLTACLVTFNMQTQLKSLSTVLQSVSCDWICVFLAVTEYVYFSKVASMQYVADSPERKQARKGKHERTSIYIVS